MLKKVEKKYHANRKFRLGLNGKLLVGTIVPLVIILFVLASIIVSQVIKIVSNVKSDNIQNQINSASIQIEEYFEKFFISEEFLKDRRYIDMLLVESENSDENFSVETSNAFPAVIRDLKNAKSLQGNMVESVWLASLKNKQLIQSDGSVSYNYPIEDRIWYKMIQENPNKTILTPAYKTSNSNDIIVTVATPYYDENNKMIGIIGIDILMHELNSYLNTLKIGKTGYLIIYDSQKNIIYHPDSSILMSNLNDIVYTDNIRSAIENEETSTIMKYERGDIPFYGSTKYIEKFDWVVVGCMPRSEYLEEVQSVFIIINVVFLICIITLILICMYNSKRIIKPLEALNSAAKEFAKGNLDVDISKTTDDEVGDLTDVFVHTQSTLKEIISDIGYVIKRISDKDLTVRPTAKYQGSFIQIESALIEISERMNTVLQLINTTSDQVDSGANQVASGSQSLAQGSTQQASSVEELANTINEVSQQMQQMSLNAQQASNKAINVGTDVERSSGKMQLMVQAMERIDKSSNEIQKIIKAIEDIAFQTNILALNAAVEAARAGTAGKGFAVVADEVRNLAGKSAEASKTTATLISNSLSAVNDGMTLVKETNDSLVLAVSDVQEVAESINDVSSNLYNYVNMIDQLTIGIDQISSVVQVNSATAEESAAASEELSAQANALKNMMSEFKFDKL